jgi:hypothetical protein
MNRQLAFGSLLELVGDLVEARVALMVSDGQVRDNGRISPSVGWSLG